LLTAVVALMGFISVHGTAHAAIYWGDGLTLGRANLDGSYRLDGYGAGSYVGINGAQEIYGACAVAVNGTHVYWGDSERGSIGRANLDGSGLNYTLITGAQQPCSLALDGTYVYWGNFGSSTIGRARLDGSEPKQDFVNVPLAPESIYPTSRPCGIAVDGAHIYWAGFSDEVIGRADLSGATVEPKFIPKPGGSPCGIAVADSHLYWGSRSSSIGRATLDGANVEPAFIGGLFTPCGLATDGTHLYWIEELPGQIGRANLDGTAVTKGVVTGTKFSCAVAINSLSFSPPPPQPPKPAPVPLPTPVTICKLEKIRRNPRDGSALVAVRGSAIAEIEVLTKGLKQQMVSEKAPKAANGNPRRWWVRIWPADDGRIGRRLERRGRVAVQLRVRCSSRGETSATVTRELTVTAPREPATRGRSRGA
jgi:hypothetical protein